MTEMENYTIKSLSCALATLLAESRAEATAVFEAQYILGELLNCNNNQLIINQNEAIAPAIVELAFSATKRRMTNEPLQYIFQKAYFMNLELFVSPSVLIPRPETELLVEWAEKHLPANGRMLDIGCGSGAIPLAVADERSDGQILAVDISPEALQVAERNLQSCGFKNVELKESNLFSNIVGKFDVITANLPYVSFTEYLECPAEVREFEPQLALTAPDDGVELIAQTIAQAYQYLSPNGWIGLEMGETQAERVCELFAQTNQFEAIKVVFDYNERPRFVVARAKGYL